MLSRITPSSQPSGPQPANGSTVGPSLASLEMKQSMLSYLNYLRSSPAPSATPSVTPSATPSVRSKTDKSDISYDQRDINKVD